LAEIFITHSQLIINTPSTSLLTISSTTFVTETATKSGARATTMPKATSVLYKYVTITSTVSCLNFTFPKSRTVTRRLQPEHIFVDQSYEHSQLDVEEPAGLHPIAAFGCHPQGTATLYTTTMFSSVIEDVTVTYLHGYSNS
jgi:hypothetical protein